MPRRSLHPLSHLPLVGRRGVHKRNPFPHVGLFRAAVPDSCRGFCHPSPTEIHKSVAVAAGNTLPPLLPHIRGGLCCLRLLCTSAGSRRRRGQGDLLDHHPVLEQMLDTNVLTHRIAPPRSTSESQRGGQTEVEHISDRALRSRHIDQHSGCRHCCPELVHSLCLERVCVEHCRVATASECYQRLCSLESFGEVGSLVDCQHRRELLKRKRFICADTVNFCEENLCRRRAVLDSRHFRNSARRLSDHCCVQVIVDDHQLCQLLLRCPLHDHSPPLLKFLHRLFVHRLHNHHALLARADHSVVESL
mmetsp:Transcript_34894/g.68899  ORF Transcript_34894/g.68899 Transcript_34894/m.68899 type:complete len:305 (-) Transcript_34894:390-1304(-)